MQALSGTQLFMVFSIFSKVFFYIIVFQIHVLSGFTLTPKGCRLLFYEMKNVRANLGTAGAKF